jgi:hypothetical protein
VVGAGYLLFLKSVADFYGGLGNDDDSVWWGGAMVLAGLTLLVWRFISRRRHG